MENFKQLFDSYYIEVCNIAELLSKFVNAYRLLIGGAGELNGIALARRKDVKDAIERANQLGDLIDVLLDALESVECCYLDYIRLKADVIAVKTVEKAILTEIDNELMFQNTSLGPAAGGGPKRDEDNNKGKRDRKHSGKKEEDKKDKEDNNGEHNDKENNDDKD